MLPRRLARLLPLLLALSAPVLADFPTASVGWPEDDNRWKTLETPHFRINYTEDEEVWAQHTADAAETIHDKLVPVLRWDPKDKTEFTLVDDYDFSNGWATPIPFSNVHLFVSPPDSFDELEAYDDWLYYLISHEYTHTLHLDKRLGAVNFFQKIFGRFPFLFPNTLQPNFMTEGLAVWSETDRARHVGRGQSSYYAMEMRMEVKRGMLALNQLTVPASEPPYAPVYLYGDYLIDYLDRHYGRDKLDQYIDAYSSNLIPYWLNPTARAVYGKDFPALWQEMQEDTQARYRAELNRPVVAGTSFGTLGQKTPLQFRNGYLYAVRADNKRRALLERWQDVSQRPEKLVKLLNPEFIDVGPDGRVLVTELIPRHDLRTYSDIYLYDKNGLRRLSYLSRFREARWLPNGDIVARRISNGMPELLRLNAQGQEQALLWVGKPGEVLGQFTVEPQGRHLIAMYKAPNQDWQLAEFDLAALHWRPLLPVQGLSGEPSYTPDSKAVVFTADFDGRYDIRKLDLGSGSLTTLTQVDGGAFQPTLAPDGTLYYQRYDVLGFVPHALKTPLTLATTPPPAAPRPARELPPVTVSPSHDYSALDTLAPRSWFPYLLSGPDHSAAGVITLGGDALAQHNYMLSAGVDSLSHSPVGSFVYQYSNRYQLTAISEFVEYQSRTQTATIESRDHVELDRFHIFDTMDDKLSLEAALIAEQDHDVYRRDNSSPFDPNTRRSLAGVALHFNNSESYLQSISPAWGRDIQIGVATQSWLPSDYKGQIYGADWKDYFGVGAHNNVIALHLLGLAGDNARSQPIFLGGENNLPFPQRTFFIQDQYPLRGYPSGVVAGPRAGLASVEWRFPISHVNRGWNIYPVGLTDITGTVFTEAGAVWDTPYYDGKWLPSVGAELSINLFLGFALPADLRFGLARGLESPLGETRAYVELGADF